MENNTGTELPSTGATGTIIFITVGGLMVVAMGVLLVVRKRMSKVVYTR
ncbi:MAG: LPXTG cell wall anchor domain-containing protein [Clostridia bacterium]|nr:LPXTG cell wall anchor domain-containing protein [Clostridia bacterium]